MDDNDGKTLRDEILEVARGEPIIGICIKPYQRHARWDSSSGDDQPVRQWEDVAPWLGYTYDHGYGGVSCHSFIAWTESRVIFVSQYDGSSWVDSMPRNPTPTQVYMPGGG